MSSPDNILHERLLRMEAGEPIASCLQGVPQEISQTLKIAVKLRHLEWPEQSAQAISAQRSKLLSNDFRDTLQNQMNNISTPKTCLANPPVGFHINCLRSAPVQDGHLGQNRG
jgi:hypothetical protein